MKKINYDNLIEYGALVRHPELCKGKAIKVSFCPFEKQWKEMLEILNDNGVTEFVYGEASTGTTEFIIYLMNRGWAITDTAEIHEEWWKGKVNITNALVFTKK